MSAHSVDPDAPAASIAMLAGSVLVRLLIAAAFLAAYLVWARPALPLFGGGIVAGFLVLANVEMIRRGRSARLRREHLVPMKKEG